MKVRDQVRAARREAYRDAILETARVLFETQGFRAITMADIAKAARVAKGTLYNYFDSKEEIFAALAAKWRKELLAALDVIVAEQSGWARLLAVVHYKLKFFSDRHAKLRAYRDATAGAIEPVADPGNTAGSQAVENRLKQCLEALASDHALRTDLPIDVLVVSLSGSLRSAVHAIFDAQAEGKQVDVDQYAEQLVRLFRHGAES